MKTNLNRSTKTLLYPKTSVCALICTALLALISQSLMAATITSTASGGLWSATGTWVGGAAPGMGDDVVIATTSGSQVTVDVNAGGTGLGNAIVKSVTVNPSATLGIGDSTLNGRTLTITNYLANNGTITLGTGASSSPTETITFTNNCTWTGSGDLTTASSSFKCKVTLSSGASLDISGLTTPLKFRNTGTIGNTVGGTLITGTQVVSGNGNSACTFRFDAGSSLVTANPNGIWGVLATFNLSAPPAFRYGSSVTFNGAAGQVTTGLTNLITSLAINNTGAGVTLSQATTVSNLTLTAGKLITTAANLLTVTNGGTGISGGSASAYVNGPLAQVYGAAGSKTFPVGLNSNYRAVGLNLTTLSGTPTITVTPHEPTVFGGTAPAGYTVWTTRDWTVASSVASGNAGDLTVDGTDFTPTGGATLLDYNGTPTTALTTGFSSPNYLATSISLTASSDFALGCSVPSAPTITSVSAPVCSPVEVDWGSVSGASSYNVYRKLSGGSYGSALATGQTGTSYFDSAAAVGNTYVYAVTAVAACGAESAKSSDSDPVAPTGAPTAPVISTVTPGCGSLTVNWGTVSGDTGGYNIYRKLSGGAYGAAIANVGSGIGTYLDSGATDGTKTYVYAVSAIGTCEGAKSSDSTGASPNSAPSITGSPVNYAFYDGVAGQQATFTVAATGTGLTYQWQVNKSGTWGDAVEGTDGTGSQTASFTTVNVVNSMSGYQYRCVVSGACSPPATSGVATLSLGTQFRSLTTGNWAANTSWQISADGVSWNNTATGVYPGATAGHADTVEIRSTHGITIPEPSTNNAGNVTIDTGGTLTLSAGTGSGAALQLTGNLNNQGTINGNGANSSSGTIGGLIFAGNTTWSGSGSISSSRIAIYVNTGATLTLGVNVTMYGSGSKATANISGTLRAGSYYISNAGSTAAMRLYAGATLETADPGGIGGTSATSGALRLGTGALTLDPAASYIFDGTSAQTILGTGSATAAPSTVADLTLNNPNGVTLSASMTVNGTLTLTSGKLTTTSANLLTIGSSGSISGGSASAFVNGPLAQVFSAAGSKPYPIGTNSNYRAVLLNLTTISGTPTITVTPHEPSTFGGSSPSANLTLWTTRDWTVASSGSGNICTLTVDGTGFSPTGKSVLADYDGTTTTALSTSFSAPNYSAAGIALTASSDFALGDCAVPTAPSAPSTAWGSCQVAVSWSAVTGASSYDVYRKESPGGSSSTAVGTGLTGTSYNDTPPAGTNYVYAISAVSDCGGESATSGDSSPVTPTGVPYTPAIASVVTNCQSLTVNWGTVVGDTGGYNIYRKLSGGLYGAALANVPSGTGTYTDSAATDATKVYVYAVSAVGLCESAKSADSAGASPNFAPSISGSPAAAVTNLVGSTTTLTVTATGTGLTYQWQVDKGSGFVDAVETIDGTGSTTASFTTVVTTTGMSGYEYQCVVSGTCTPPVATTPTTLYPVIYVRSAASGSFSQGVFFEMSVDGSTEWVPANAAPNSNSVTTIRSGHSMTNSNPSERQVRSLTIDSGGSLYNGTSTTVRSLAIFGSLTNNGALLSGGGANAHHLYFRGGGTWTGSGDLSTGAGGIDVTVDSGVTLDASGLTTPIKLHATVATPFTVNGTLNAGSLIVDGNGNAMNIFTLDAGATLVSANPNGLTGATAALNFLTVPSLSTAANYTFDGSSAQASTGLPVTVNNLTIANTASVALSQAETVSGTLAVNAGATLDFNGNAVRVANAPSLGGALVMEVSKTGPNTFTGSTLTQTGAGTLSYAGALAITASGLTLAAGDSIPLFSAPGYAGGFSSVTGPPTPGGLTRNISELTGGTGGNITFACDGPPVTSAITGASTANANQAGVHYSVTLTSGSSYAWTVPVGASITSGASGPDNNEIVVTFGMNSGNVSVVETIAVGCVGSPVSLAITVQNLLPLPVTITDILGTTLSYNGGAGTKFVLLSSPGVDAAMSAWTRVETNSATPGTFAIPAVGSSTQLFYRIQSE